jgi:hypothetical protein
VVRLAAAKHRPLDAFQKAMLKTAILALVEELVTIVTNQGLLIALRWHGRLNLQAEGLEHFVADCFERKFTITWLCPETGLFTAPLGPSALSDTIDKLRGAGKQIPITGQ